MSTDTAAEPAKRRLRLSRQERPGVVAAGAPEPAAGTAEPAVPSGVLTACLAVVRRLGESELTDLAVTSTRRGEGRSTVALGTALVMRARPDSTTVVLELDFERPSLAASLHLPPGPGLAELLRGERTLQECLTWVTPQLGVVRAGAVQDDAEHLSVAFAGSGVLAQLAAAGHRVVGDLPPLPPHGRADRTAGPFAATLLVVRAGRTPLEEIRSAVRALPAPPAVVLNGTSSALPSWLRAFGL